METLTDHGRCCFAVLSGYQPLTDGVCDDVLDIVEGIHQKLHHVPYYIDILLNRLGMFNLGIISTFFTLRSYFINSE